MTKGGRFYMATFVALIELMGWPAKGVLRNWQHGRGL